MFKEKITAELVNGQYTGIDATLEILVIILTSFILGWIAR
jgi:hypothetical protein